MQHPLEIVEREAEPILFVTEYGPYEESGKKAFETLSAFAMAKGLITEATQWYGISYADPATTPPEEIRFDAAITHTEGVSPESPVQKGILPAGRYAFYLYKGSYDGLEEVYARIYTEWIPMAGYRPVEAPPFEHYLNDMRDAPPEELLTGIYVPVAQ